MIKTTINKVVAIVVVAFAFLAPLQAQACGPMWTHTLTVSIQDGVIKTSNESLTACAGDRVIIIAPKDKRMVVYTGLGEYSDEYPFNAVIQNGTKFVGNIEGSLKPYGPSIFYYSIYIHGYPQYYSTVTVISSAR